MKEHGGDLIPNEDNEQLDEMSCKELVELVTEYLDDVLPAAERDRFEAHMSNCVGCTDYLAQMRLTLQLSGRIEEESLATDVREGLLEAFRGWKSRST